MAEDFDNHRRIFDGSDDLQGAAAVGAALDVDVEDPFEQSRPTHARRFSLTLGVIGRGRGGTLCRSGNDFTTQLRVGRQHAVEANEMETRARHQGRQALHELQRLHDDMGGAVFERTHQLQHDIAGAVTLEPFIGDCRAGDIAAQVLELLALIGAPAQF